MGDSRTERPPGIRDTIELSSHTTLELGGPARHMLDVDDAGIIVDALRWASESELESVVLGGGSNVVVSDDGFDGLVLRMATRGVEVEDLGDRVRVTAAAGEEWDELVAFTVGEGMAGMECLAGIPGTAGATPIQNVGAYGVEVSELIESVQVFDRTTFEVFDLPAAHCGFSYRFSRFRAAPQRHVILSVSFLLHRGVEATVRYPELVRAVGRGTTAAPTPATVREAVLDLRRSKSMVLDPGDANRRSVGSFFLNPLVCSTKAAEVVERALASGLASSSDEIPHFPSDGGRVKLSAAWLVERSGFAKATRRGAVGISSNHALALVHHGDGTTSELMDFAERIVDGVRETFGVILQPEPVFLGFPRDWRLSDLVPPSV